MNAKLENKGDKIRLNIELDQKLSSYFKLLKEYHGINANNDMLRNLITEQYKIMVKEKRELGLGN